MPHEPNRAFEPPPASAGESTYRVKSVFRTVQGEGHWIGRPAVFVRLVGCNMWSGFEADRERDADRTGADCPRWCDTDFTSEGATDASLDDLTTRMREIGGEIDFCVLTGGEPFLQADAPLIRGLHRAGYEVAVETNGTISLEDSFRANEFAETCAPDWITCSPKLPEDELVLERFDELKLIVPDYRPSDYQQFIERATVHTVNGRERRLLWLQPEDGPRLDEAQALAVDLVLEHPEWRVSTQTHKTLGVA